MLQAVGGNYRRKIKTVEELCDVIGSRPRAKKVIMCHGVFDLVHPGHIRHLLYAKEKADILVASLTADAYITKAQYRPFVPQELRALNLAALEMVDFVVIDAIPRRSRTSPASNPITSPRATNMAMAPSIRRPSRSLRSSRVMAANSCSRPGISSTRRRT